MASLRATGLSAPPNRDEDWDPASDEVQADQRAAYDRMRERCPVAYSERLGWSVFRHEDVRRILDDHDTFSNAVSHHLSVPNGMDPPEHTRFRRIVERYFARERVAAFEPACRAIVGQLIDDLPEGEVEFMGHAAEPFAVAAQCAFMGWPDSMREPLRRWMRGNVQATRRGDRDAMAEVARTFEGHIAELLAARRRGEANGPDDVVASLLAEEVEGRPLTDAEITSILRNWTVGEIGTIAAASGVIAHFLANDSGLQARLRREPGAIAEAIEEILRLHGPLVSNRRVARRPVEIGGRRIEAGDRLTVMWIAANRDEGAFEDAARFRFGRDHASNLLYGAGIHVCPGAPLARMELRLFTEALLDRTGKLAPIPERPAKPAASPASGFATLPLLIV